MRRTVLALAVVVPLVPCTTAVAQVVVPRDWNRVTTAPRPGSELASCATQGGGALFRVAFEGSRLTASAMDEPDRHRDPVPYDLDWAAALNGRPTPPGGQGSEWATTYARDYATRIVVPVDDGYLIGFGGGEYGGSLWWYPREPGPRRVLAQIVVRGIVPTPEPGTYIVIDGLAHLGMNTGAALWIDHDDQGQWRVDKTVPLHGSPYLHAARPDGILLADYSTVDLLTWDGDLRTVQRSMMQALPGSFAFGPGGEIAIGRSVLVNLLVPTGAGGYRDEWFVPKQCQTFTYWRGVVCMCGGAPLRLTP